ncbi:hypothetical protein AJ88_15830 [Mesorhizobium amorphae CCBAU 01583]|nr:hypothetical protein AJ88_15830 [Mesorhizobium amorphae CCBAU 01583]
MLAGAGLTLADVSWRVEVANLKPYHHTLQNSDRVAARLEVTATETTIKNLEGLSTEGDQARRLVPGPAAVTLGHVQALKPTPELPGLRLRVYAPKGLVYAPTDIETRIASDSDWTGLDIAPPHRILNPASAWATYRFGIDAPAPLPNDPRVNPSGLAASYQQGTSLGLVDDGPTASLPALSAGLRLPMRASPLVHPTSRRRHGHSCPCKMV